MDSDKKTAVYCRTIEEYNIVAKHYGRTAKEYFTKRGWNCIKTDVRDGSHSLRSDNRYTDIPFDEWVLTEMPRIGDKVIITKSALDWVMSMDKYVGKIVTVTSTKETYIQFDNNSNWVWDFLQCHFRIATPEEIAMYENPIKDKYVKITNNGLMYTTHSQAEEYGCTNYDYRGNLLNSTVCRVIATPYINNGRNGYVLEYDNKHYLIEQAGTIPATKEEYEAQFKEKDSYLFVKGQWYKGDFGRYMKFSHVENRGDYNKLFYTERIYHGKYELINNYWANNDMEKHALEYPLEKVMDEIQPFLPEGHPDKNVKILPEEPVYIASKWYKLSNCWYAKCSKDSFDKEKFYGNERYNSNGEHGNYEFTATLEGPYSIVELTESMIDHKTPIELKSIITNNMKDTTKPEPKYKVGDELKSCEGGWQYSDTEFELQGATSFMDSDKNIIKGKCTKVQWSNTHQIWWYKIGNYGNMFTESGVKLVDKMKSIEPEYSKYTIEFNSQREYEQCLDYFENILKISVDRMPVFTPNWNKFKYNKLSKLWILHGYDDTVENVVSLQSFINDITKIPYKLIPKFSEGNKVKICSSEEDIDRDGYMCSDGRTEQIEGVAGKIKILTGEIKEKNGNVYYGYEESKAWIKESCLSLVENETVSKDSAMNPEYEDKITEYKGYKVGDAVIVKNKPTEWSSALNNNDPRYEKYPITGVIKNIECRKYDESSYYAMDMGGYGWSLTHLIDTNNISKIEDLTEYAGLRVGDILKEEDINKWRKIGENYECGRVWGKSPGTFYNDRHIKSFKLINGVVGFRVSGTLTVYLRADGYLDFIKNKNIEKDDSSLEITKEEDYSQKTLNLLKKQITII